MDWLLKNERKELLDILEEVIFDNLKHNSQERELMEQPQSTDSTIAVPLGDL